MAPAAIATVAGWKVTKPEGSESVTDTPPVGAGLLSVIVPWRYASARSVPADSVRPNRRRRHIDRGKSRTKPVRDRRNRGASDPASRQDRDVDSRQTFRHSDVRRDEAIVPLLLSRKTI